MKREIGQLWLFAKHYFSLARRLKNKLPAEYLNKTLREISYKYPNPIAATGHDKSLMLMTAHLSSCSMRLVTVGERLEKNHMGRVFADKYSEKFNKSQCVGEIAKELMKNRNKYIHKMLRDNVGHIEREKKTNRANIYEARQQTIEKLTFGQIYDSIDKVVQRFKKELAAKHLL